MKKNKTDGITRPDYKIYYNAGHKIKQCGIGINTNGVESNGTEINCIQSTDLQQGCQEYTMRKVVSSINSSR